MTNPPDPASACILCPVYRPDSTPRLPHRPPVCDGDRQLLSRHLGEIAGLIDDLSNPEPPIVDQRRYERIGIEYRDGQPRAISLGETWADPVAAVGGVAPINSRSRQPSVSGSRERPIPVDVTALDLQAPARIPSQTRASADWPEDQVGHLSAATLLDEWVRDVRTRLLPDHYLPDATVHAMVGWLRTRADLICDRYPDVVNLAEAVRMLRGALRTAAGQVEPRPRLCEGVACPRCDLRALMTCPGDTYRAQCGQCGTLLTDDEYTTVVAEQHTAERGQRSPDEIAALLRRA